MRRTKIVATIGPASKTSDALGKMIKAGMDVARLNFSHGSLREHGQYIKDIREISKRLNKAVAIIQDVPGPKIRVGKLPSEGLKLTAGQKCTLSCNQEIKKYDGRPFSPDTLANELRGVI